MKRHLRYVVCVLAIALPAAAGINACFAQVETINPNPLEPAGVGEPESVGGGSTLGTYHSGVGRADTRLRSSGPGDNPAGTMLRELNGPLYDQGRGHVRIGGPAALAARKAYRIPAGRHALQAGAVYFADRGAYEDTIYRPQGGTYRYAPRPRQTSYYRGGRSASTSSP